jgi:tetratricopeptide (TPR) repeat protein
MTMPPTDQHQSYDFTHDLRRWLDRLLVLTMAVAAAVLASQELSDADVWWHLRSGQWIWEHRAFPIVDPFSFASAGSPWIDLHWGFQLILAFVHRLGGIPGIILLASAFSGLVVLIGMTARLRKWPVWIVAAAWIPALLLIGTRVPPRPEIASLAFIAAYMAILFQSGRQPAFAWALPAVQLLWVNTHSLFILGPVIMGAYLADRAVVNRFQTPRAKGEGQVPDGRHSLAHLGLASLAVVAACFVNPYGLKGVLLPFELFPKISSQGGIYKANILEFYSPARFLEDATTPIAIRALVVRAEFFLLVMLPISISVPAIWRLWSGHKPAQDSPCPAFTGRWLAGTAFAGVLTIIATFGLPLAGVPAWLIDAGRFAPIGFLTLGLATAAAVAWRSPRSAALAACSGVTLAGGIPWLVAQFFGLDPTAANSHSNISAAWPWIAGGTAIVAIFLTLQAGGRLFRISLVLAFGYLALQALRNINIFGVIAGFVLASEFGEWAADWIESQKESACPTGKWWGLAARGTLAAIVLAATVAAATDRLPSAVAWPFPLGLRESPRVLAHDAARFAGQAGMPLRCLAFGLDPAAVFLYHNAPERKPFMDPRLEVASKATFETYLWLDKAMIEGRPGWSEPVERMGEPSILLDHNKRFGSEATLLADTRWRCVYFDAVASVFVPSRRTDLEAAYPTIDFAARFFHEQPGMRREPGPNGQIEEALGLVCLGHALPAQGALTWTQRLPILLQASARARAAIAVRPENAKGWLALACGLLFTPESVTSRAAGPADTWDPATSLATVQAIYALRRSIALEPVADGPLGATLTLISLFRARGMIDAAERVREPSTRPASSARFLGARSATGAPSSLPPEADLTEIQLRFDDLIRRDRTLAAVALARQVERSARALPWTLADRVAIAHLYLGEPAEAIQFWNRAEAPPSPALRLVRIAQAEMAITDFTAARNNLHKALTLDARLGEALFALALLELQAGDADAARAACKAGLSCSLTARQHELLVKFNALVERFAGNR